jgi:NAD(P)H dehydrogenase (quinone)
MSEKLYREMDFKDAMSKTIDKWSLKYPGIETVEHLYFHAILSVSTIVRKKYLEQAYLKGKEL